MNANSSLIMQKYNSVQRFLTSARQAKISPQEVPYPNHNPAQVSALIRIHLYAKKVYIFVLGCDSDTHYIEKRPFLHTVLLRELQFSHCQSDDEMHIITRHYQFKIESI